jgi:hypothetical protein
VSSAERCIFCGYTRSGLIIKVKQIKNVFVIMSDESDYGKRITVDEDRAPVDKAAGQYAVSPTNQAFIKEYRTALQAFISKHRNDADPDIIQDYERELNQLPPAQN